MSDKLTTEEMASIVETCPYQHTQTAARLRELEAEVERLKPYEPALEKLISVALTCSPETTLEWLQYLEETINKLLAKVRDEDRVKFNKERAIGRSQCFEIIRAEANE